MTEITKEEIITIAKQALELSSKMIDQQSQNSNIETQATTSLTGFFISVKVAEKFIKAWSGWKNSDAGKFGYFIDKHKVELSQVTFELLQELRKSSGELEDGK